MTPAAPSAAPLPAWPLLRRGFRPFFLVAGLFAVVAMAVWALVWRGLGPPLALPPVAWHAHEMVYGYALAVVAGFLLTAVRNWTGLATAQGIPLALLCLAWMVPRMLLLGPAALLPYAAAFDLLFDGALLVAVAAPIVRARQTRQAGIIAKLLLLSVANLLFYADALGLMPGPGRYALQGGVLLLVALILTLAGRVMPGFITRGLGLRTPVGDPVWVGRASLVLYLIFFIALLAGQSALAAPCAALLAGVTAYRLWCWHRPALWRVPLLWGLFLAVAAIACGLLLYALSPWLASPGTSALHALGAGGIGLATLAMMARVALGHTGRDLGRPPAAVAPALLAIATAAIVRVLGPLVLPAQQGTTILLAQLLWCAGFALFVLAYTRVLLSARVDDAAE